MDNEEKKDLYERRIVKEGFVFNEDDYEANGNTILNEFEKFKNGFSNAEIDDLLEPALNWYDEQLNNRLNHFTILATVDDKGYTRKLKGNNEEDQKEIKNLNNRIGSKSKIIDIEKFADLVGNKGHSFCVATFGEENEESYYIHRRKNNFNQQHIFALDFDDGITFEEVINRAYRYKIPPIFAYKTFSCDDVKIDKFRVIWVADFCANSINIAESVTRLLMTIYPESDKSCKDCCRLFYGGKGIIYKSSCAYLERLSLTNLCCAVEQYIEHKYPKDRLKKMREISKETGIVLIGGRLDVREIRLNEEQIKQVVECAKEKEWHYSIRCYLEVSDCKEILNEELLDEEGIIYGIARKINFEFNKFYFIRMNTSGEIKEKHQTEKKTTRYNIKSNVEYSKIKDRKRGITREMLYEKCQMIKYLVNDEYLTFDELFGICTNLINIEGGLQFFKEVIKESQYNITRDNDWVNFKADQLNNQGLKPMSCKNFCTYREQCRHATNIINTVKTKRNTVVILKQVELLSLKQGTDILDKIVKGVFENE